MKVSRVFIAVASLSAAVVEGLGQNATVTTSYAPGLLQLGGKDLDGQILVSEDDWWGVLRAAKDLAGDIGKVTGRNLTLGNWVASSNSSDVIGNSTKRGVRGEGMREKREWANAPHVASDGTTPAWGNYGGVGGGNATAPSSSDHSGKKKGSAGTTVYYNYEPVTGFVNVSLLHYPPQSPL